MRKWAKGKESVLKVENVCRRPRKCGTVEKVWESALKAEKEWENA